eukprot:TRINITY_DN2195_c0_g1_i4.p2 TRINITY_DN2195_c0_g1~~TRINITY_DN2195_c0_g1_i4.p2  ORF type:complete len:164 (-),score=74.53 TRINITY_DN2195_c0_g1_i4:38-529(-)
MADIIKLQAEDDQMVEVPRNVAVFSGTVKDMLADFGDEDAAVPLPNVKGNVLAKAMEFAKYHVENPAPESEETDGEKKVEKHADLLPWDKEFIEAVDQDMLFNLMLAANYLNIKALLDVCAKCVAGKIKGKDAAGIREVFGLEKVFTDEQEKELRAQIDKIEG